MGIHEQLHFLKEAYGDSTKLALAAVDIAFSTLPDNDREDLKNALKAAAIPHWCDLTVLAILHQISLHDASILLERLSKLTSVELYPARGINALNVHETTRSALRKRMALDQPDLFRNISAKAKDYFEKDLTSSGRIEWIYHFLSADPDQGALACEVMIRKWIREGYTEGYDIFIRVLKELVDDNLLKGRALVVVLLCIGEAKSYQGETVQLESLAKEALVISRRIGYLSGIARANALLGDVFQAQGLLTEAKTFFEEYLLINRQLCEKDPNNLSLQRDLAASFIKVGGVLRVKGKLVEAKTAIDKGLRIFRQLCEQNPNNASWQRDLATAFIKIGGVLQARRSTR